MGVVEDSVDSEVRDYADLADLANLLWRERETLQAVLFDLTVEQLVVNAGLASSLPEANRRLDAALERLRAIELTRAMESDLICDRAGLPTTATLAELAELAAQPWQAILLDHRDALLELAQQVRATADQNRRLLDVAARSVRETLASITASIGTYDARGAARTAFVRPVRLDEQA